jgi:hypothetical protein
MIEICGQRLRKQVKFEENGSAVWLLLRKPRQILRMDGKIERRMDE